jgi:hypothetical protein
MGQGAAELRGSGGGGPDCNLAADCCLKFVRKMVRPIATMCAGVRQAPAWRARSYWPAFVSSLSWHSMQLMAAAANAQCRPAAVISADALQSARSMECHVLARRVLGSRRRSSRTPSAASIVAQMAAEELTVSC